MQPVMDQHMFLQIPGTNISACVLVADRCDDKPQCCNRSRVRLHAPRAEYVPLAVVSSSSGRAEGKADYADERGRGTDEADPAAECECELHGQRRAAWFAEKREHGVHDGADVSQSIATSKHVCKAGPCSTSADDSR